MMSRRSSRIIAGMWGFLLLFNLLARCSRSFSDWYAGTVFPFFSRLWSCITGLFSFSVGERLIVAGIILLVLCLISFPVCMCFSWRKRAAAMYGMILGWILTWLFTVLTFHFFVLYQCTPLGEGGASYSAEEFLEVTRSLAEEANALSDAVARDENGYFVLTDDLRTSVDAALETLSRDFPRLGGKNPPAKPIDHSYFFSQQYLLGIYFPFTMEANYNPDACDVKLPVTVCHELVHLKGYIFEDEAGFFAYLACINSSSADLQYSGAVSALEYMLGTDLGEDREQLLSLRDSLKPEVQRDLYSFVPDGYWEDNKDEAILPEEILPGEIIGQASDIVLDTSLKVNGVAEGGKSYFGMTGLLLDYYYKRGAFEGGMDP